MRPASGNVQVRAKLAAGAMTLDKFVITKQLTKRPEDYPDAKNQPHVQVALAQEGRQQARWHHAGMERPAMTRDLKKAM